MNLRLPDAIKFARMAGPPIDGKRTRRAVTSISESTEEKAEKERQRLGLPNLPALYHFAILHLVDRKKSIAVTVNLQGGKGKKSNCANSDIRDDL